jgi:phospholipid/cholesterol/gamma-HCH transport system ATP-binding protein
MSGSGKSVLLEHLVGLQQPDRGEVRILGLNTANITSESKLQRMRSQIGLVFQGSALIDSLSVVDNVMLPLITRGICPDEARQNSENMLKAVGLSPDDGRLYPSQLSGGMQKRVGIARALITDPAILLYDEPTTGLDAATSNRISRLMRQVQRNRPHLVSIAITHDYFSAGIIADRVLYLNRDTGRLEEILAEETIRMIRGQCGDKTADAVSIIRGHLEEFFNGLTLEDRPAMRRQAGQTWTEAFFNVAQSSFRSFGDAVLLLTRIGFPRDQAALAYRIYEIGFKSLLVACSAGAFFGMMMAVQIGLGLSRSGLMEPLPRIVSAALIDKVGPLLVGLLLAGRIAASVSAEIGGKRVSRQFDALRAMAIPPETYWLSPIFWASVISLPLLMIALEAVAFLGAFCVAVGRFQMKSAFFVHNFLADVSLSGFLFGLFRTSVFGAAVALVGYAKGAEEKRTSDEVGQATTVAVVGASLGVIILDFVMTFVASI